MSTINQPRRTHAETAAWYTKYEGELHRLEAAAGGWSREIADQARAFADGKSVTAAATSTKPAPVPSDAAANGAAWARTLGITYGSKPTPAPAAPLVDTDAIDWDAAFGTAPAEGVPTAQASASDAMWDEAFGKEPATSTPSSALKPEPTDFSWDDVLDQHKAERHNQ
ncbi:MAG: hypothetical protein WBA73_16175 [Devosia sp.]